MLQGMLQGIEQRPTENGYALAAIRGGVLAGKGGHEKKLAYVQNIDKQPLMATSAVKARMLLSKVKRRCFLTTPFTIQLTFVVPNHVQPLTHAVDPGSGTVGSSVVTRTATSLISPTPQGNHEKDGTAEHLPPQPPAAEDLLP
jgi:RRXRR protein